MLKEAPVDFSGPFAEPYDGPDVGPSTSTRLTIQEIQSIENLLDQDEEKEDSSNDDEFQPIWRTPQFRNRMAVMTNRFSPTDKESFEIRKSKGSFGKMLDFQKEHLFNRDKMVLYTLNPHVRASAN